MNISVLMPVHNGETTLKQTLESLLVQTKEFDELVIVDDGSADGSIGRVKEILAGKVDFELIENGKQRGLAAAYNRGIKSAKGDIIVTLHQDIVLKKDALEKLVEPFRDEDVVAATHLVSHPLEIWNKYNFWQKVFFARLAGKDFRGIDGKFDAFRRSALEAVGYFDEKHFRTAGEDGDILYKLKKIGRIAQTEAKIIHIHRNDPDFGWREIVRKQAQYSEAQGALLARGRIRNPRAFARSFFREILLAALLVPYLRIFSAILILTYSFLYTKKVYQKEWRDKRIVVLPFLNIFLLFVSLIFFLKGFAYGKQWL
jgi:glycosyltransferase involved in cell wall biosynthesis